MACFSTSNLTMASFASNQRSIARASAFLAARHEGERSGDSAGEGTSKARRSTGSSTSIVAGMSAILAVAGLSSVIMVVMVIMVVNFLTGRASAAD
ncbi:hypothetical protein EBZ80_05120 [bacterium]|nr:hypothetical protein [bacterium]